MLMQLLLIMVSLNTIANVARFYLEHVRKKGCKCCCSGCDCED